MKNADRLRRLIANTRHATDKEEAFFDFLLISPSYQLARKRRLVGLSDDEQSLLPSDFNRVLEIYDVCGDIFGMDFEDWWDERGRDLLRSSESNEDLIAYPVDLKQPADVLIKAFSAFIRQVQADRKSQETSPITILPNKTRIEALHTRLALVNDKGRLEWKAGKKIENWRLGVQVGIKSKWTAELKDLKKRTYENLEARTSLGVLVSKHLKEALYLAENAARGVFPSLAPTTSDLSLNFEQTWLLGKDQLKLSRARRRQKANDGIAMRKTYYERKVKPMLKRQKVIEALVQARLLLQSL